MIQSKQDLKTFLEKDRQALGIPAQCKRPRWFWGDDIWKFQRALRYHEYHSNVKRGGYSDEN